MPIRVKQCTQTSTFLIMSHFYDNLSSFTMHYFVFQPDLKFEFSRVLLFVQKYVDYIPFLTFSGFSKVFAQKIDG